MKNWLLILLFLPFLANAGYQRNVARPVNKVVFGSVDSVRYITHREVTESQANGWQTLLGATVGGIIGHQFGRGTGRQLATGAGAIAGGVIANQNSGPQFHHTEYQLVELLIRKQDDKLVDIIQDVDQDMLFQRGDKVRILYFDDGVRVDKEY